MPDHCPVGIVITDRPIGAAMLQALTEQWFGDMVKIVVDIRRGLIAIGGELHADAEVLLLEGGSLQADLWGANYMPGALINIRPGQGNRSMVVQDPQIAAKIRAMVGELIGLGEPL
jgi:hypothetical protein